MRKFAAANPALSYPDRKALVEEFIPQELSTDTEVAAFIEQAGESLETFVQGVKDGYCSDTIVSWA